MGKGFSGTGFLIQRNESNFEGVEKMKSLAVINQKGGSGKTTFSSLLVKTLSEKGHSVLAVDLDPQGGLSTIYLGETLEERKGLFEFLVNKEIEGCIHPTERNLFDGKIEILPSDYRADKIFLSSTPYALKYLKELPYDFCVIDTPPTVQGITKASIDRKSTRLNSSH